MTQTMTTPPFGKSKRNICRRTAQLDGYPRKVTQRKQTNKVTKHHRHSTRKYQEIPWLKQTCTSWHTQRLCLFCLWIKRKEWKLRHTSKSTKRRAMNSFLTWTAKLGDAWMHTRPINREFTHSFADYIVYEVMLYSLDLIHPPRNRNFKEAYCFRHRLFTNRMEWCMSLYWASPKYHAKILRNVIIEIMIKRRFLQFWMFRFRQPFGVQLSKQDRVFLKNVSDWVIPSLGSWNKRKKLDAPFLSIGIWWKGRHICRVL